MDQGDRTKIGQYTTDGIRQRRDIPEPNGIPGLFSSNTSAPGLLFPLNEADHTRKTVSQDRYFRNDSECYLTYPAQRRRGYLVSGFSSTPFIPSLRTNISFPSHTRDFDVRGCVVAPPIYNKQLFNDAAFRQSVWPLDAHLLSVSFSHTHCLRTLRVLNAPN
jgi:hypothetical protein